MDSVGSPRAARACAALRPVAKGLTRPLFDRLWPRVDARIAEAFRPVPMAEFEEFRKHLPLLLDAISAQNAASRHLTRRVDGMQRELWDRAGELSEGVKGLWERLEAVRSELMYELRYGGQSVGVEAEVEPKILSPDKLSAAGDDIRLNLGSGALVRDGYLNVDVRPLDGVDIVADISHLPFGPAAVSEIHSEHLLEHFPEESLRRKFLPYWVSLLKPGGTLSAVVPDAGAMLAEHAAGRFSFEDLRLVTFGGQEYDGDFHFTMFTSDRLGAILREAGLVDVTVKAAARRNGVCLEMELEARAARVERSPQMTDSHGVRATQAGDPMRVCLYSGLNIDADAISNSLRLRLRVLKELRGEGLPLEVSAFVQNTDAADEAVVAAPAAFDVISHPAFGTADAHVFEFGVAYDLFDLVFLAALRAPTAAVYHNVTPVDLVDESNRGAIERSMRQRYNLFAVDHVSCVSEVNRQELVNLGLPEDRLSVSPLPPSVLTARPRASFAAAMPGPLRVLFVGRLVRAKGILDLLDALEGALRLTPGIRLTIVGNEELSEPAVAAEVRRRIREGPVAGHVRFLGRVDDAVLAENYARADVLVMPSYHEGFCVPVVEAFAAGAYVVAYDSSNLPNVVAGLGSLVPVGDVAALTAVLVDLEARVRKARDQGEPVVLPTARGEVVEGAWRAAVAAHVAEHSYAAFRRRFAGLIAFLAARRRGGPPGWLSELEALSTPVGARATVPA